MRNFSLLLALIAILLPTLTHAAVESRTVPLSYGQVDGKELIAECVLYYDPKITTPRPAVLVFPEWWGLNDYAKGRARQLAELGYVTLAVDVYGEGKVTKDPDEAAALATPFFKDRSKLRDRATKALEILMKLNEVNPAQIGAMGYCFGGTAALELARTGAPLKAAISFHGDLSNPNPEGASLVKAKLLVCHGALDPLVPMTVVTAFTEEMNKAKTDYVLMVFANAQHTFTNPNAKTYPTKPIPGLDYNPKADLRSWQALKDFLTEAFK